MKKKTVKNRYGVQIGDIFDRNPCYEEVYDHYFYQVIALRGETQVVVREIGKKVIAFDGIYEGAAPVPDTWISDEVLVRKVCVNRALYEGDTDRISIRVADCRYNCNAYLEKKEMHLAWYYNGGPTFADIFKKYNPELAKQLDLKNGSGVFAADRPFESIADDCRAIIRYPDGRQQETILNVLLHYEEEQREYERFNSPKFAQVRQKLLDEWRKSQKGAFTDE